MRRFLLGCSFGAVVLCVACVGLAYFVGLPRIQDEISDQMADGISTVVAGRIAAPDVDVDPGTYVITEADLLRGVSGEVSGSSGVTIEDVVTEITPAGITVGLEANQGQDLSFSAVPVAVDGRVEVTNVEYSDDDLRWFMPKDKLGDALEDGINSALTAEGLIVTSLELQEGQMVIVTEPAA